MNFLLLFCHWTHSQCNYTPNHFYHVLAIKMLSMELKAIPMLAIENTSTFTANKFKMFGHLSSRTIMNTISFCQLMSQLSKFRWLSNRLVYSRIWLFILLALLSHISSAIEIHCPLALTSLSDQYSCGFVSMEMKWHWPKNAFANAYVN